MATLDWYLRKMFDVKWRNSAYKEWMTLHNLRPGDRITIRYGKFEIKVNGTIYNHKSEDLDDIFQKMEMWDILIK